MTALGANRGRRWCHLSNYQAFIFGLRPGCSGRWRPRRFTTDVRVEMPSFGYFTRDQINSDSLALHISIYTVKTN
jgi:hypothetical protein